LYTTICNLKPNPNPNLNSNPDPNRDPNPNPNSNPNPNPTVITDPQIGRRDPQTVTVQIRPTPHFVVCRCEVIIMINQQYTNIMYGCIRR